MLPARQKNGYLVVCDAVQFVRWNCTVSAVWSNGGALWGDLWSNVGALWGEVWSNGGALWVEVWSNEGVLWGEVWSNGGFLWGESEEPTSYTLGNQMQLAVLKKLHHSSGNHK